MRKIINRRDKNLKESQKNDVHNDGWQSAAREAEEIIEARGN